MIPETKEKKESDLILYSMVEEAASTLNEEQKILFEQLIEFLEDPEKTYFVIEGYAGTGKTYTVSKIIQIINGRVAMTAPTNKAVKVLSENKASMAESVSFATIHKLLALTIQWIFPPKGSNEEPYQKLVKKRNEGSSIGQYKLLVVDEVSMLDDELLKMINSEKPEGLKIIFMGDPAQIPPVNKPDSIPLIKDSREEYNMLHFELTKIMRQAEGNKILKTAYQIRNGRHQKTNPILDRISNKDVHFYSSLDKQDYEEYMGLMLYLFDHPRFNEDPNFVKAIAWTNKRVDYLNSAIRKHIYRKEKIISRIMPGEKLIAGNPVRHFYDPETIIFNNSDEFTVISLKEDVWHYTVPDAPVEYEQLEAFSDKESGKKQYSLKYYDCQVEYFDPVQKASNRQVVHILHESAQQPYTWILSKLKRQKNWREKIRLQEKFAYVQYNYAITAHKAQGSTYGIVFLSEDDIDQNRKDLERNRIKYTSATRPKYQLHILGKWNQARRVQKQILLGENNHDSDFIKQVFGG